MADTYEVFYNGKPLNPNRGLPPMTYAQAEDCGLTESERLWCRTDGEDTPITADDIPYDSNNSVKDKIDDVENKVDGITFTGLLSSGVSSTGTEVEGTLSESIDNFDLIVIVFTGSGGTQCCSMVIPTRYSNRTFYGDIVQSSNVYSHGEVKVNGNKIYVKANSFSGWLGFLVSQAYGIKL